ncbi:DUF411 domain-containing protein [Magnetospirillum sp. UT-4]|uniref:DUF411 domain-containing protein n=1 Tax=Magnetospirillum sp. UT-4 TaxID=2681467 RepID=UPI00137E3DDA|nr:DUF411 domain-containing protein [Magnetospirillum sp. UT-4]CAA7626585.1 Metal-binding protein [Magnetospirillum sp. UT-4]
MTMRIAVLALAATMAWAPAGAAEAPPLVEVWKSPSCGCCGGWIEHMKESGYRVKVTDIDDVDPVKAALGVPRHLRSCHTARVAGYVVEGHVPAEAVGRLLRERPTGIGGLSSPDMPSGSPGMPGPKQVNEVRAFGSGGETVYGRY